LKKGVSSPMRGITIFPQADGVPAADTPDTAAGASATSAANATARGFNGLLP
jgi:hypothetical protein